MKRLNLPRATWKLAIAASLALPVASNLAADEPVSPTAEIALPTPVSAEQIEQWGAEMDSSSFSERQAAANKLGELGKTAFPTLEKIAAGESREASARAMEILKRHLDDGDETTRSAAKECLERLAKCDNEALARRATQALTPPEEEQNAQIFAPQIVPAIRIAQARAQIQIRAGGNNVKRVTIKNNNGIRDIEAEENGRKVKITDDPNNGIKMEVTEKEGAKEVKKEYSAKNAAELKEKHPEAHKIYEQYGNQGGIQINGGGGIQIQQGGLIPVMPAPGGAVDKDALKRQLENINRMIEQVKKTQQDMQQRGLPNGNFDPIIQRLEETKARLEQQQGAAPAPAAENAEKPASGEAPKSSTPAPNTPATQDQPEGVQAAASASASASASSDGREVKAEVKIDK